MRASALADPRALLGEWRLDRTVLDRRTGTRGCVHGALVVTDEGGRLHWAERGTLRWDGREVPVERTYLLVPGIEPGIEPQVLFADGRPFHPWRPGEWVEHPCAEDLYRGLVTADAAHPVERVLVVWEVRGPAKDQRLVTRLRRVFQEAQPDGSPPGRDRHLHVRPPAATALTSAAPALPRMEPCPPSPVTRSRTSPGSPASTSKTPSSTTSPVSST